MPDGTKGPWVRELPQTLDLLDFAREARERVGIDRLEICQMHMKSSSPEYVEQLRAALAGSTLIGVPIDVGNISAADPAYRDDDLRETEAWIDVAAALGAPMVRVNANGAPPFAHEPICDLAGTIASLRRLVAYGSGRGVKVLIENHGGITEDPATVVRLAEESGCGVCVDVGNFEPALSRQRRDASFEGVDWEPLYAAIRQVAPYATVVHAKTARFGADGRHQGWDVVRGLRITRDAGFDGDVSIEYGGGVDAWENVALTKKGVEEAYR